MYFYGGSFMNATKVAISMDSCIPKQFTLLIIKRFIQF